MISKTIKDLRAKKNVTQEELGKAIGLTTSMIGMYETEARKPSLDVIKKLADYFNVSTDYILYGFDRTLLVQFVDFIRDNRTYEQFAADIGEDVNEVTLICMGLIVGPPRLSTLERIAANNPIDWLIDRTSLLKAAGYIDDDTAQVVNKELSKKHRAELEEKKGVVFVPRNVSAHFEGTHFTDEETEEISNFIAYMASKKNRK